METLQGVVETVTYKNDDNSYTVFRVRAMAGSGTTAVVGNFPAPLIGEEVELTGQWVEHARFGRQFKAITCQRKIPTAAKGIERFLASGVIKGIGPAMAARLVERFGDRTLEVLELYPHRLTEVPGVGAKKAEMIRVSFAEQAELREIMLYLESHGVSGHYGARISAAYGPLALDVLRDNPYRLAAEVDGIGFRTADQIAMAAGLEANHPDRLAAGIHYALFMTAQTGHCCVPDHVLAEEAARLLAVDPLEAAGAVRRLLRNNLLYAEDFHGMELVYPPWLYYAEKNTAERLREIRDRAKPVAGGDYEGAVKRWESSAGMNLAEEQRQAMVSALAHGVLVLTGGPGTGKTTTVRGILALLEAEGLQILLGAPTGRAAKRLSEATGRQASTLHRLLEAAGGREGAPQFGRTSDHPLEADVLIVDEGSMMDISLTSYLLQAVPDGCRFILVGDVDQLPAVGPGSVLKDIIRSGAVPVVRLTEVFRQSGESIIIHNAHRINRGLRPDLNTTADFQFRDIPDGPQAAAAIVELCARELTEAGYDAIADIQVLSPMHRHDCGVENLNRLLQEAVNPPVPGQEGLTTAKFAYRTGDKVMQGRNNYNKGVFNGDIGVIAAIDNGIVFVRYPDGVVTYEKGELDELQPAYAMSVHKSQGSEYPVVILPLVASHHIMLQRNLLYTAVTRAKEMVILVGSKAALNTALANDRTKRRYSLLAERLRGDSLW